MWLYGPVGSGSGGGGLLEDICMLLGADVGEQGWTLFINDRCVVRGGGGGCLGVSQMARGRVIRSWIVAGRRWRIA